MSVDARTAGRKLDSYRRVFAPDDPDLAVLVDPDLVSMAVEVTVTKGGLLGRGLDVAVDGIGMAPCPIQLI